MGMVARLLGKEAKLVDDRSISRLQAETRERTRRELISMAVWDTLKRHGLPAGFITADALPGFTPTRQRGVHIQLVYRDWQPGLLGYVVALEAAVKSRLGRLDPLSSSWITGVSWRFEPEDCSVWPQLPATGQACASSRSAGSLASPRPAVDLESLLQSGDASFRLSGRGQGATPTDFSPTLPMN